MKKLTKEEFKEFKDSLDFVNTNEWMWEWDLGDAYVRNMPLELCPEDIALGVIVNATRSGGEEITDLNIEYDECYDQVTGEDINLSNSQWLEICNELDILIS